MIKSKIRYIYISNCLLIGNIFANTIGNTMADEFIHHQVVTITPDKAPFFSQLDDILNLIWILSFILVIIFYEWPVRKCLHRFHKGETHESALMDKAKKRILNEPYFILLFNVISWKAIAVVYLLLGMPDVLTVSIATGLITIALAFFWVEFANQSNRVPLFFPDGGLNKVTGVWAVGLKARLGALIFAVSIVPLSFIHLTIIRLRTFHSQGELSDSDLLNLLQKIVSLESLVFAIMAILLSFIFFKTIMRPMKGIINALNQVVRGDYNAKTTIYAKDEIGFAGETLNLMTDGLKEKERLKKSLSIAQEIQQFLLPSGSPQISGLDIAGKNIFCEETGGDYYDFLSLGQKKTGVVIGDVSGHGIGSALFMSMARALLRSRSTKPGSLAQIVGDVNRELTNDLESSGQFMTLFYLLIDQASQCLRWVRAGHDPAIVFDSKTNTFSELKGSGIPLGVDADFEYHEEVEKGLKKDRIILIGTDGIWESRRSDKQMFGKQPIYRLLKKNAHLTAKQILNSVIDDLFSFHDGSELADDVTLVVIKI